MGHDIRAGVGHLQAACEAGGDGYIIDADVFCSGDLAADKDCIAVTDQEVGAGNNGTLVTPGIFAKNLVRGRVVSEDHSAVFPGHKDGTVGRLTGRKLQVHGYLFGIAFGPVHGGAQGNDGTAVDETAKIAVQTGISGGICCGHNRTAMDHEITVGINAVAFRAETGHNVQLTAPNGCDGNTVFVGIDAVIVRTDGNLAAVNGQMQLGVQTFIFCPDIQTAGSVDIHGHIGVYSAVLLDLLLFAFLILVDFGHIGTGDRIDAVVCQNQVCAGGGGVHVSFGSLNRPVSIAFIDISEKNGRGDGTGDICAVQNQIDYRIGILIGILAQVDADLALVQSAGNSIVAGGGDIDYKVLGGFFGGVHILCASIAVGISAFIMSSAFVVDDITADVDIACVGGLGTVNGDALAVHYDIYDLTGNFTDDFRFLSRCSGGREDDSFCGVRRGFGCG